MPNEFYEIPGGLNWCKANLKIIIGNSDLADIMNFGDLWCSRGHKPLVHVVSPSMDNGKMWDKHKDPSGLLNNIPAHIDLFIVDFFNLSEPEIPSNWANMTSPPKWLLWEYKTGKVKFNGTYQQFIHTFSVDPAAEPVPVPVPEPDPDPTPDPIEGSAVKAHLYCPHCGKRII